MEAPHHSEPESEPDAIRYVNRATGEVEHERVFGGDALRWIYGTTLGRTLTDHVLSRPVLNRVYGFLKRRPESRSEVEAFVERLGIDASEAARPLADYTSLDDFFTRRLRPGARPVDPNPRHLLAPADSRVLVYPQLSGQTLRVKGTSVTVEELMGDDAAAHLYEGGSALVFRLAPADYHRFHFPDDVTAGLAHSVKGRLHSVHPIALTHRAPSFRNKRSVTRLWTHGFGEVGMIEVGALLVGTIVQTHAPGRSKRGAEKGYFRFGGSTVVLLCEPGRLVIDEDLREASAASLETLVRMGTRVGRQP